MPSLITPLLINQTSNNPNIQIMATPQLRNHNPSNLPLVITMHSLKSSKCLARILLNQFVMFLPLILFPIQSEKGIPVHPKETMMFMSHRHNESGLCHCDLGDAILALKRFGGRDYRGCSIATMNGDLFRLDDTIIRYFLECGLVH